MIILAVISLGALAPKPWGIGRNPRKLTRCFCSGVFAHVFDFEDELTYFSLLVSQLLLIVLHNLIYHIFVDSYFH